MKTPRNPVRLASAVFAGLALAWGAGLTLACLAGLLVFAGLAVPARGAEPAPGAGASRPAEATGARDLRRGGGGFTRLVPLPAPKVVRCADEYPGGSYRAAHLVDGSARTEYSSNGKGLETFVEFAFEGPVRLAAFRHVDRNDPATVAASELALLDAEGQTVATVPVAHTGERSGVAIRVLPAPVEAKGVRWRVTRLGPRSYGTVGGAEIQFFGAGDSEPEPRGLTLSARLSPVVERTAAGPAQALCLDVGYPYAEETEAAVEIEGFEPREVKLGFDSRRLEYRVPAADSERALRVAVKAEGRRLVAEKIALRPPRPWEIHLLPHSHVDIGYTAHQSDVEKKQDENIEMALELIRRTRDYPEGSRFRWNVEVLWPVENYLRAATPEKRAAFFEAVRSGEVGLDAFYGNILTGLCRPEELVRLLSYATRLSALAGVPIESAMISDVPGYTWSTVSAMAHAGVRYFSFAPNYFDRMGGTMVTWQDKPFWWVGPDGRTRVLCWCPSRGYALGHLIGPGEALARFLPTYLEELEAKAYPYDLTYLRWNVHGDNGAPDEKIADVVRDWNARFAWPRLTIATTAATFREFERRYGDRLPEYAGDYTPYWEDGAGSSAFETALNRASAERLVQAETLWAIRAPGPFPAEAFHEAWRNVLLYSEHTWGAYNSVSEPDVPFVLAQWKTKRAFALDADRQSRELLERALPGILGSGSSSAPPRGAAVAPQATVPGALDVFNAASFARTDLVAIPAAPGAASVRVLDDRGDPVPSQRLSTGEIAFVARDVPGFGARRYRLEEGAPAKPERGVKAQGNALEHPEFSLRIDEATGAIASLRSSVLGAELVDAEAAVGLNDYVYLPGADPKGALGAGPPRISVREPGPVVASLAIESAAPGCRKLLREVRVVAGLDRVEIANVVDKAPVREKEGVHFGFGFRVPDGTVRIDVGLAAVRPEVDQIPASSKNWFSVQRWVDISNAEYGVTWAPVDAPLLELGGLTANLLGSQTDHRVWIQKLEPTQTIYSWVMNNHWHTNYRAEQEGPVAFRYAIRPHRAYAPAEAARFGVAASQPLIA
ncbi:MAG: hypothetical protein ACUVYA_17140, partial [Planctomycetota bacterium]